MQKLRKIVLASGREMQKRPSGLGFAIFHEGAYISEVRCWLALRASVLRRAVSSAGTAQERRTKVSAGAVSWDFGCTDPIRWSSAWRLRRDAEEQRIGSLYPKSQDTAPALTFVRRSCAVPAELTARRSTLARSANQHLTSLM